MNWLVIGISLLFVGIAYAPAIAQNTEKQSSRGIWLYVGGTGPGNYTRIRDAIDNASDGDTVFVYDDSSPYYESIYIEKSIDLIGENRSSTVIDGSHSSGGNVISAYGVNLNISGFTIQNQYFYCDCGICIQGGPNDEFRVVIHDNIIIWNRIGIGIEYGNCDIYNNMIYDNSEGGICVWAWAAISISIHENLIMNNPWGIFIEDCYCYVYRNTIQESKHGIRTEDTAGEIKENNFIKNRFDATHEKGINWARIRGYELTGRTRWVNNYWDGWPVSLPHPVKGYLYYKIHNFPIRIILCIRYFDRHPAQEPYDIKGVT